jgi:hypothetical protein
VVVPRERAERLRELLLRLDIVWPLVVRPFCVGPDAAELYAVPVSAVM